MSATRVAGAGAGDVDDDAELVDDASYDVEAPNLRALGRWLVVTGVVGLLAAFTLTADKVRLLEDPSFKPSCDLNPVLSCGSVMVTDQASAFGFPNSFLGLIGFSVVLTLGVLLAAGVSVPRWVLVGLSAGSVLGVVFVHWLAFQSLYRINALCPWCMVVWVVTILTAVLTVLVTARTYSPSNRALAGVWSVRYLVVVFWYAAIALAILVQFWSYWRTLL